MLFFLTVAVFVASANAKFYTDCGSKLATLKSIDVSGCDASAKECVLKKNTNATINIDFTPTVDVGKIETEVHGIIMNLPVPFPMSQPDACKDSGLTCPVKAGSDAHYVATLPVLKSYPKVKVDVKWELKTDNGDLICVLIAAKIN